MRLFDRQEQGIGTLGQGHLWAVPGDEEDTVTKIEWANPPGFKGESWNPVTGCSPVSPGCENCWAQAMARRFYKRKKLGSREAPFAVTAHAERLHAPLKWRKPRCVFVCSMGDLFHPRVPFEFIDKVFAVMSLCPQHRFLVLTKRPERMAEYHDDPIARMYRVGCVADELGAHRQRSEYWSAVLDKECEETVSSWPLPNVALGTSVEDQQRADERIPLLLQCPAAMRFISVEPMLGPVDLREHIMGYVDDDVTGGRYVKLPHTTPYIHQEECCLHWVITGCESGPKRRACKPEWMMDLLIQCAAANVPAFIKQVDIRSRVSHDPSEWAGYLRVRQWPKFLQETPDA